MFRKSGKTRITITTAKKLSRGYRRSPTEAEDHLWKLIRKKNIVGMRFLRQYPIYFVYFGRNKFFIADFYCHEKRLVVEVDGGIHDNQKEYGDLRNHIMDSLGYRVVRFTNEEILYDSVRVLDTLTQLLKS